MRGEGGYFSLRIFSSVSFTDSFIVSLIDLFSIALKLVDWSRAKTSVDRVPEMGSDAVVGETGRLDVGVARREPV